MEIITRSIEQYHGVCSGGRLQVQRAWSRVTENQRPPDIKAGSIKRVAAAIVLAVEKKVLIVDRNMLYNHLEPCLARLKTLESATYLLHDVESGRNLDIEVLKDEAGEICKWSHHFHRTSRDYINLIFWHLMATYRQPEIRPSHTR